MFKRCKIVLGRNGAGKTTLYKAQKPDLCKVAENPVSDSKGY